MRTCIHHIETLLPEYSYRQDYARDRMIGWLPGKRNRRLIQGIYDHSDIDTRYSVLPDFGPDAKRVLFHEDRNGRMIEPTTRERNLYYRNSVRKMVVDAGRNALENAEGFSTSDITHVVTTSCTGFYNPGPDLDLITGLNLSENTERYNIGFMGCYAAFPALRMADHFCRACPDAVVLVVCIELCTLHLQFRDEPDSLLANALFADGAAAVLVSARTPPPNRPALLLHDFTSALAPEGESEMAWEIGDRGFNIRLSAYVPDIIAANIGAIIDRTFQNTQWKPEDIGIWAVHPGGRAILDRVANQLHLDPGQLEDSRAILRQCGNMSSATILFVLSRIMDREPPGMPLPICAMAFGPGLTIESALLEYIPARNPSIPTAYSSPRDKPSEIQPI